MLNSVSRKGRELECFCLGFKRRHFKHQCQIPCRQFLPLLIRSRTNNSNNNWPSRTQILTIWLKDLNLIMNERHRSYWWESVWITLTYSFSKSSQQIAEKWTVSRRRRGDYRSLLLTIQKVHYTSNNYINPIPWRHNPVVYSVHRYCCCLTCLVMETES